MIGSAGRRARRDICHVKPGQTGCFRYTGQRQPICISTPRAPFPHTVGMPRAHRKHDAEISIPQKMPVAQGFFAEYPAAVFAFSQNIRPALSLFHGMTGQCFTGCLASVSWDARTTPFLCAFHLLQTPHILQTSRPAHKIRPVRITLCIKSVRFYVGNLTLCLHFAIIYEKLFFAKV